MHVLFTGWVSSECSAGQPRRFGSQAPPKPESLRVTGSQSQYLFAARAGQTSCQKRYYNDASITESVRRIVHLCKLGQCRSSSTLTSNLKTWQHMSAPPTPPRPHTHTCALPVLTLSMITPRVSPCSTGLLTLETWGHA